MAAAQEHSANQQSKLADLQASHTNLTQALEQQLSVKQSETKAVLQQLESTNQNIAQLQAACQQQSEHTVELEAQLVVSHDTVTCAEAELASQADKTAGMVATLHEDIYAMC